MDIKVIPWFIVLFANMKFIINIFEQVDSFSEGYNFSRILGQGYKHFNFGKDCQVALCGGPTNLHSPQQWGK